MRRKAFIVPMLVAISLSGCAGYGFLAEPNESDANLPNLRPTVALTTLTAPPTFNASSIKATNIVTMPAASLHKATQQYTPKVSQNIATKQLKANSQFGVVTKLPMVGSKTATATFAPAIVNLTLGKPVSIPYSADNLMGLPELGHANVGLLDIKNRGFWYSVTIENTTSSQIDISSIKYSVTAGDAACKDLLGSDAQGNSFNGPTDMDKLYAGENPSLVDAGATFSFKFATACQAAKGTPVTLRFYSGDKDEKSRIYNFNLP